MEFRLDGHSGVAPYMQLVQQVKQALRLGFLQPGDQLPTVREVIGKIAINPNTVFKAYRELEYEGLVESRPGQGTFVRETVVVPDLSSHKALRSSLGQWLYEARAAGLDWESITALFDDTVQHILEEEIPSE